VRSAKFGVTKSWIFRFVSPVTGKTRWMGLGGLADGIGQADARGLALAARKLVKLGKDPIDERDRERAAARLEQAKQLTFAECADAYIAKQASSWTNAKHKHQWCVSIDLAKKAFGDQLVGEIDKAIIVKFLRPIWTRTPESASRLRNRIEKVIDWAIAADAREGPNPARWGGNLEHLFAPVQSGAHFKALPFEEVPGFVEKLCEHDTVAGRAFELLILTAARTAEVVGATWEEFDLKARVWTIPGNRMKAGCEHSVPLSDRAVEILNGLYTDGSGRVFIGTKLGVPLGSSSLRKQLHDKMGRKDITVHGLRSSFRDWAGECTEFENETIEFALAHGIPDRAKAAYRRYRSLGKRRKLMELWAAYCDGRKIEDENVSPMIRAAR
jgi:integrase